ncbi:MAG TPA: leucyl/phenylalanyl-tRNA--protein transferase [Acidimicrobiales bacterium]|nr:leucyl/phenylalanyl-tRNA--protein transferase [Acidimicrobiales bacterium]
MPVEPPPSRWAMEAPARSGGGDLVAAGADLDPGTLLAAYRAALFPMPVDEQLGWWSPDPRGVLPLDGLRVSRSLRRSCRRYSVSVDTAFDDVIEACAEPRGGGEWITPAIRAAYRRLHRLGWAHSVECRDGDGALVGGLYGVAIGGLFAGESMFHRAPDASKVALVALVDLLREGGAALLDVQWSTPHLASLGVVEVSRPAYLRLLTAALERPLPAAFAS